MSFLKIRDPTKRNQMVEEYLDLKKNIRDNLLSERTGEKQLQTDLSKFYRPITETQKAATKEIREGLKPIKEGIVNLPQAIQPIKNLLENITLPTTQPFHGEEVIPMEEKGAEEGEIARKYLDLSFKDRDTTFGIIKRGEDYYFGNTRVIIKDNDIIIADDGSTFEGTPGIWELTMKKIQVNYTTEDLDNYKRLVKGTYILHRGYDPKSSHPRSSDSPKWVGILSPIWKEYVEMYKGKGIVIMPSDPNALLERLDLLLASQEAGHTGVGNELVSICDELKRQGVLDAKTYKKLNSIIKK